MEIVRDFEDALWRRRPTVVGIGVFDGVHRGHQFLIETVRQRAAELDLDSGIVTFEPHPQEVLGHPVARLSGMEDRLAEIGRLLIGFAAVIRFTREFSRQSPEEFVEHILVDRLDVREVVVGFNFHFGRGGTGTPAVLAELGERHRFAVRVIGPVTYGDGPVSSSAIRDALAQGRVDLATRLLGRPYHVTGTVVSGAGRGQALGFPTANLDPAPKLMLPGRGVYGAVARIACGSEFPALVNVGTRPTFELVTGILKVEAHLHGFAGELLGQRLVLALTRRIRDEKRFGSASELVHQLEVDRARLLEGDDAGHERSEQVEPDQSRPVCSLVTGRLEKNRVGL
jgi:riboflavin kinase/FMN adenylyltransferase